MPVVINRIMINIFIFGCIVFASNALADRPSAPPSTTPQWQTIPVASSSSVKGIDNQWQTVSTGCALGADYAFYFLPGKQDKVLVYFNGGGACWDDNTCVTSLQFPNPTYNPSLAANNTPVGAGGILDMTNANNPFYGWSVVFMPYCTGDIHWGTNDTVYHDALGNEVPVHHRGFNNFLAVRQWLTRHFANRGSDGVKKLVVAGSSAGSYGATLNFPHLANSYPNAKHFLIADAGSGVITNDFLNKAIRGNSARWGVSNALASVPGLSAMLTADESVFATTINTSIANAYPDDKFSQFTTAWDVVQTQFLNIMRNPNDPGAWAAFPFQTWLDWSSSARGNAYASASSANYRYYIANGVYHMALIDVFAPGAFYAENSAQGVVVKDWIEAMVSPRSNSVSWDNLECSDCAFPPISP